MAWHNHTVLILHILTYHDSLRILLFWEIWIVIEEVDVGNISISILFVWIYIIYIYIYILYIYIYIIYIHIYKDVHWLHHRWYMYEHNGNCGEELSSVSIVLCILIVFWYIFSTFTTSNVSAIRRTSLLWSSPLSCSVALMSPLGTNCVYYCSEMVR